MFVCLFLIVFLLCTVLRLFVFACLFCLLRLCCCLLFFVCLLCVVGCSPVVVKCVYMCV